MTISVTFTSNISVTETIDNNVPAIDGNRNQLTHNAFNTGDNLDGSSTPPVTQMVALNLALVAGAATIDLTSLTGTNGIAIDGTGLKVQLLKFKPLTGNSNPMTIKVGATNGYQLGGANYEVQLSPGEEHVIYRKDTAPDISATAKTLDLVGTGTEGAQVMIIMG